jgi:predicted nucleic acid-binding protein
LLDYAMASYWLFEGGRIEKRDTLLEAHAIQVTPGVAVNLLEDAMARSIGLYRYVRSRIIETTESERIILHHNEMIVDRVAVLRLETRRFRFEDETYWIAATALIHQIPVYGADSKAYRTMCPRLVVSPP